MRKSDESNRSSPRRIVWTLGVVGAFLLAGGVAILAADSSSNARPAYVAEPDLAIEASTIPGGEVADPCGTAVDSEGNVYISDAAAAVYVFDSRGAYRETIRAPNGPCGLATDSRDNLYVVESDTGDVIRYGSAGGPKTIDASGEARGIAVDLADDRLYVAKGGRIDVYDAEGRLGVDEVQRVLLQEATGGAFRLSFQGASTRPLPFDASDREVEIALVGLPAIGPGDVSVTQGPNGRSDHRVSFEGALGSADVEAIEVEGSGLEGGPDPFLVEELTAGFDGRIGEGVLGGVTTVVAYTYSGSGAGLLASTSASTTMLASFSPGTGLWGEARFANHEIPNVDERIHYVFADGGKEGGQVKVLAGADIRHMSPRRFMGPTSSEADFPPSAVRLLGIDQRSGHIFVYDESRGAIDELEAAGPLVAQIASDSLGDAEPAAIALGAGAENAGVVYVADRNGGSGTTALAFSPLPPRDRPTLRSPAPKVSGLCGIAVDSNGAVYFTDRGDIAIRDGDGEELGRIEPPRSVCDLAVDGEGNLYAGSQEGTGGRAEVLLFRPDSYPISSETHYAPPETIDTYEDRGPMIAVNPANDHLLVRATTSYAGFTEYSSAKEGSRLLADERGYGQITGIEEYGGGIDVCARSGNVYVAGKASVGSGEIGWRVYVLNPAATRWLTAINGLGSPAGPFPSGVFAGIAVDQSNCHVLIASPERATEEYEASGAYVGSFGSSAVDVAVDSGDSSPGQGNVYTAAQGIEAFGPLDYASE